MSRHTSRRHVATRPLPVRKLALAAFAALTLAAATAGCSCSQDADSAKQAAETKKKLEEKKKQERKPPFEFKPRSAQALPSDERQSIFIKPGHWFAIRQGMRANHFSFNGQAGWTPVSSNPSASSDVPVTLDRTGYRMSLSRPLYLDKKQKGFKNIEMTLFAPAHGRQQTKFKFDLAERSGRTYPQQTEVFGHLGDHTYFMVVLAREPDRYFFLNNLDSIKPPTVSEFMTSGSTTYYHVLRPKVDQGIPLPSSVLTWTAIAYVLWDDLDPGQLSSEQQQAMLDWLHWGGQILVSGPESLDKLRGSFLEPHLPVRGTASDKLSGHDFDQINEKWTDRYGPIRQRPLEAKTEPWSAVLLEVNQQDERNNILVAKPDPENHPLVVERQVGRGRVVVTAFRLRQRDLRTWPGFDNFFNACLLRRPSREFSKPSNFGVALNLDDTLHVDWAPLAIGTVPDRLDPSYVTAARFFSRDAGYEYKPVEATAPARPGLGGWSDFNDVSNAARSTIREAAGIEIPTPSFVATVLCFYLIVLVPLNWTVFRVIHRIELAWVAAPLISLASAAAVIHMADLNIGFARSATHVTIVEAQEGYSRAHVTRYTAVYTSLSTPYSVQFDDADAQAQPFALRQDFRGEPGSTPRTVRFQRSNQVTLSGFHVDSNSTGLMHSEQFIDLGGKFVSLHKDGRITGVKNLTDHRFERAFLVRRFAGGGYEFMPLGDLAKGGQASGDFRPRQLDEFVQEWVGGGDAGELNLKDLVRLAASLESTTDGDVRLVAVNYGDPLPGMTITPTASQRRSAMMLVANLEYGPRPGPVPDVNVRWKFVKQQPPTLRPEGQEPDRGEPDGEPAADAR